MRTTSSGSTANAIVRHLHTHAISTSNVEQALRFAGSWFLSALISSGPKKNDRWTKLFSSMAISVPLVLVTFSNSWCIRIIRGGFRAFNSSLCHMGSRDGTERPWAISPMVLRNWIKPSASDIVWFRRSANINPPHLNRITCILQSSLYQYMLKQHPMIFVMKVNTYYLIVTTAPNHLDIVCFGPKGVLKTLKRVYKVMRSLYLYSVRNFPPYLVTTRSQSCRYGPLWTQRGPHDFKTCLLG